MKNIVISLGLFSLLFASVSGFAIQVPHVYYITNNYPTPDGAVAVSGTPNNCTPTMGWVKYKATQEFLCKNEIGKDEDFEFNAATNDNEYFITISCFSNDFRYFMTGKAITSLKNCGAFQKKK